MKKGEDWSNEGGAWYALPNIDACNAACKSASSSSKFSRPGGIVDEEDTGADPDLYTALGLASSVTNAAM